ncbi:MAG: hypothetical protein GY851_33225 [bacterium]|nr:hypothetical protein [bacterium]
MDSLKKYVMFRLYPKLLAENGVTEARVQLVQFLLTQPAIEEIVDAQDPHLIVKFRGQILPSERFFSVNYDVETGGLMGFSGEATPAEERAEVRVRQLEKQLRDGWICCDGDSGSCALRVRNHGDHFLQILTLVKTEDLSLAQEECLIGELVARRDIARAVAANLKGDLDQIEATLRAVMALVEEQEGDTRP